MKKDRFPNPKQRAAICYTQFRKYNDTKSQSANTIYELCLKSYDKLS